MNFFGFDPNNIVLVEFGTIHLLTLAFFGILILITFLFRKMLRENPNENKFLIAITIVGIIVQHSYHVWLLAKAIQSPTAANWEYFWYCFIPLELCGISFWLAVVLSFTKKKFVFELLYFFGIGALVALLFAEIGGYGPDHFRFYNYFIVHFYILYIPIYFVLVKQYTINLKSLLKSIAVLVPTTLIVYGINKVFDLNYMYLLDPPDVTTPLESLRGTGLVYLLAFSGLVVLVFIALYLPWIYINNHNAKLSSNEKSEDVAI